MNAERRPSPAVALTLIIAASMAAGFLIFFTLVLPDRQPGWDEASHALKGALIAHDIRTGDLLGLLFDTYFQVYWPPLHSWLVAAAFLVAGPSMEAARAVSVLAFVALAPTLFLVARTIEPRRGILAGSLSAGLTLTSPGIIALAAANLLELPALLALSCTMLVYCRLERNPEARPESHSLLGIFTVLTYLAKTNVGILLVISIVLTKVIKARFRPRRLLTRKNLYVALPLVIFGAIWFAYTPKVISTWTALVNSPYGGDQGRGLAGLLFFPRAIVELTDPMSVLLYAGVVLAWRMRREPGIGFLLMLALTQFVIGELHHTKVDRHIVPMFPPLFVLTGVAGARLWEWLEAHRSADGATALALLAGVAALQVMTLGLRASSPVQTPPPAVVRHGIDVLSYMSAQARDHAPVLVLDTSRTWPHPPVVDWHFVSRGLLPVTASDKAMDHLEDPPSIDDLRIPESLRANVRRVLERYDEPSMTRTLEGADRPPLDADEFASALAATLRADPPRAIIALTARSDSTGHTIDVIAPAIVRAGYRQVSVRDFPRAEARVHVYRRPDG